MTDKKGNNKCKNNEEIQEVIEPIEDEIILNIKKNVKKIKINDNGDYISLNLNDCTFPRRYYCLVNEIQNITEEIEELEQAEIDKNNIEEVLNNWELKDEHKVSIANKVDEFFGINTCLNIFDTNTPYIEDIFYFLNMLQPFVEKYFGNKMDSLSKNIKKFLNKQKSRKNM